jgi:hypothetical protein
MSDGGKDPGLSSIYPFLMVCIFVFVSNVSTEVGFLVLLCRCKYPEVLRPEPQTPSIQSHSSLCIAPQITDCYWSEESFVSLIGFTKGAGPSTTLAWPGWKQPDIAVEVDTARLETSRFKKCCVNSITLVLNPRVFLMCTDTVKELPGYPVQNCPSLSFLS